MQLTDGDEKCVLKLCVYKTPLANLVTRISGIESSQDFTVIPNHVDSDRLLKVSIHTYTLQKLLYEK